MLTQTILYRELPTYLSLLDDAPINCPDRPARPGDLIHVTVTGAGVTSPVIPEGQLPSPGKLIATTAVITAAIGVTDLQIEIPELAPGKQFLGLSTKDSRLDLIAIWIGP